MKRSKMALRPHHRLLLLQHMRNLERDVAEHELAILHSKSNDEEGEAIGWAQRGRCASISGFFYGWSQRCSVNFLSMLNLRRRNNLRLTCSLRCKSSLPGCNTLLYTSITFLRRHIEGKSSMVGDLQRRGLQMWLFCGLLARCTHIQEQDYNDLYLTKCSPFYIWLAGEIVDRGAVVSNRSGVVVGSWHIVNRIE